MTRRPVGPLSADAVGDLVADLEARLERAEQLVQLAPQSYGIEAAILRGLLQQLEDLVRRPLDA